jgi:hypothetical protein
MIGMVKVRVAPDTELPPAFAGGCSGWLELALFWRPARLPKLPASMAEASDVSVVGVRRSFSVVLTLAM